MAKETELKAGDPCPICGGEMVPDAKHDPARLADLKKRNSPNPSAADRYAKNVQEKADQFGVIHTCTRCGYQARLQPASGGGSERGGESARGSEIDRSSDAGEGAAGDAENGRAGSSGARGTGSAAPRRR